MVSPSLSRKRQREEGQFFCVAHPAKTPARYQRQDTVVFRVVLANPLTTDHILHDVLAEQVELAAMDKEFLPKLLQLAKDKN